MHRTEPSQLRLCLEFNEQDFGTNLQMSRKKCNNNQQRRGRRRRQYAMGIHGSISLSVLMLTICMAHTSTAVPAIESSFSSTSASSTTVTVAVTPSSPSSPGNGSSSTESPTEQLQPQGQCLLDGVLVPETTVRCEKQANCRAIQRTGHCCPDYKCDCEKDGKTYANGYKLVDPDTPCTVCYCKGGEIVCSSVTCYRRNDCMPKYVPGRCCPEYDNCPILDNNPPLASDPVVSSSGTTTTTKPMAVAQPAGFNWNITIKEITKPTEIRITDDNKAKPSFPTRKASSVTDGPATFSTENSLGTTSAPAPLANSSTSPTAAAAATFAAATPTDTVATPTPGPSQDSNPKESLKLIASVGYIEHPPSSSSNAVEQPSKPLDSLQPVPETDPSKVNIKREYTTEGSAAKDEPEVVEEELAVPISGGSLFLQSGLRESLVESPDVDLEPDTAGSDNVYHIISTTEGPGSLQKVTSDASAASYSNSMPDISTEGPEAGASSSEMPPQSSTHHMDVEDDVPQVESNPAYPSLPEDDFSLRDVNFPLAELEDNVDADKDESRSIFSPFDMDSSRVNLPANANVDGSGSESDCSSGAGDIELMPEGSSTTERTMEAFSRSSLVEASSTSEMLTASSTSKVPTASSSSNERAAPSKNKVPLLMSSAEDLSGEMPRIQNGSDLQMDMFSELGSGETREPITPKTLAVAGLEIDELGSGSVAGAGTQDDPKADAESLKLDESPEGAAGGSVDKASARAERSFVERALPLGRLYLQRIY
ncbi:hypothetical protein KR018_000591 [Drosophila ironensis]|nr:hypothetical protein KR018_000591 [Drosophila ironensis]